MQPVLLEGSICTNKWVISPSCEVFFEHSQHSSQSSLRELQPGFLTSWSEPRDQQLLSARNVISVMHFQLEGQSTGALMELRGSPKAVTHNNPCCDSHSKFPLGLVSGSPQKIPVVTATSGTRCPTAFVLTCGKGQSWSCGLMLSQLLMKSMKPEMRGRTQF